MGWLGKLEKKFGKFAIKNLMLYIVCINAFVYILGIYDQKKQFFERLALVPQLVVRGEIWRLVTYIFIPPSTSVFFIIFVLYFYYMIGNALENEWGSFKLNLFYILGMIGTTAASFLTRQISTGLYLNLSLFLAFARIFPNYEILLFFIVPVRVKYLAWLNWAFIIYTVVLSPIYGFKLAAVMSVINYLIFFGKDIFIDLKSGRKRYYNKFKYTAQIPHRDYFHKCVICGVTEKQNPQMEFRYCRDCQGDYEYCQEHLLTHEHKKIQD